ncbi:spinster family MFS transporter [Thermogemmatispora sp.]|uniref:spinster family MFS transporter n=1 Tax=Thermogemmatispora sp. TaxID=1968838 RepID=UPI001E0E312C|nr:MFS transporter [Thermogemmatispora sp.]MBX5451097.1 MFS transporter [Thermogemmatispora sp.]
MNPSAPSVNADLGASRRRTSSYATYVFMIMFSINFLNYMDRYIFIGASPIIGQELGLGLDQLGYLSSAFLIIYTLGTLPFGIWADRTRRKNVVALCVSVWSLATAFTALASNFVALFLSRMVLGIGEAGYYPAGTALLSDYYSRKKRAQIMSRWGAGSMIGLMVGYVLGGFLASLGKGTWRFAFLIAGIPGLVLALLAWRLREPRRNEADEREKMETEQAGARSTEEEQRASSLVQIHRKSVLQALIYLLGGFILGGGASSLVLKNWGIALAFVIIGVVLVLVIALFALGGLLFIRRWQQNSMRAQASDMEQAIAASLAETAATPPPAPAEIEEPIAISWRLLRQDFVALFRIRSLIVLTLVQAFAFYAQGASVTFLPVYLHQQDALGLTAAQAATLSGVVVVIAGIAGLIIGGYLADILNPFHPGARILVCGIGFLLCAPSFALAVTARSTTAFMVFFFITAMLILLYNGPCTAAIQDTVPSALRASAVALSLLVAHLLGDAFAPSLVGVLAQHFDPTHGSHFAHNIAGQDLRQALLVTCVPMLALAGLIGIFGARWMKSDVAAAQRADALAQARGTGAMLA